MQHYKIRFVVISKNECYQKIFDKSFELLTGLWGGKCKIEAVFWKDEQVEGVQIFTMKQDKGKLVFFSMSRYDKMSPYIKIIGYAYYFIYITVIVVYI